MAKADFSLLSRQLSHPDCLVLDLTGYEAYFHDATIDTGRPEAIAFAETESDVVAVSRFCLANNLALVPRGAGTGLSGGCVPSPGCLVLSTERMKKLEIDPSRKMAFCGPGVITKALLDEADKYGLTYPPDPASYDESTLGGNVAENAGGLRCKRFGVTRDYVTGLKAVTISSELLRTGSYNNHRGFGLGDILIGSEGTLAVVTEIAVRLIDTPQTGDTILVAFDKPRNAAQTVSDITRAGIIPTVLEYLDGDAAACSNKYEKSEGLDDAAAILLIESPEQKGQNPTELIETVCRKNGCSYLRIESEPERVEQLWRIRRNLSKAVKEIAEVRISEDVAVPISQFPALVAFVSELNAGSSLRINSFGHAGDGNLHVNFLSMTGEDRDYQVMEQYIALILKKAIELGGTLSGEHGIGLAKRRFLALEFDENTLELMKAVKAVFDPGSVLNPGKIF